MKFSQMPYERPDIRKVQSDILSCIEALESARSFEQADAAFLRMDEQSKGVETQMSLAYVRHEIDTTDDFYDKEVQFIDEQAPLLEEYYQKWNIALKDSPFRPDFEEKYGDLLFRNIEIALRAFSPEIIPELQQENTLVTEYQKLIASAQISFEGGVYTLSQLTPFKQSPDDKRRRAAWEAEGRFFEENGERLDSLYDELVRLRTAMARKLGFENYIGLGYCRMNRNSYGREEVERFRKAVVQHLVPEAERLQRHKAERMGFPYPMSYCDNALNFRDGNARPQGDADDILRQGKAFYRELSAETGEFIDFMFQNELFDVLSKKGKAGGGFCTSFPDYRAPFIFANFNGTQGDVEVVTHEAGHAFAYYTARDMVPSDYQSPTLDACEIHSISMEFFSWPWAEGFFGADAGKFRYSHLSASMTFIPYGTMVDHFQHIVYEKPEMTPAQRHETWRELTGVYMPWIKLDDMPFYGEGRAWQRQMHIYTDPFYYIDYCLAQTVALEFWALAQEDREEALRRYMALVRLGGSRPFDALVAAAGLDTPFGEQALRNVADAAGRWLASNPVR